jgi:hypothetical protein
MKIYTNEYRQCLANARQLKEDEKMSSDANYGFSSQGSAVLVNAALKYFAIARAVVIQTRSTDDVPQLGAMIRKMSMYLGLPLDQIDIPEHINNSVENAFDGVDRSNNTALVNVVNAAATEFWKTVKAFAKSQAAVEDEIEVTPTAVMADLEQLSKELETILKN